MFSYSQEVELIAENFIKTLALPYVAVTWGQVAAP